MTGLNTAMAEPRGTAHCQRIRILPEIAARRFWAWVIAAVVVTLAVRVCLLALAVSDARLPVGGVLAGHDGGEYLDYARALARFDIGGVSPEARRHNPGWPLLMAAPAAVGVPATSAALAVLWGGLAAAIVLFAFIVRDWPQGGSRAAVTGAFALGLAYPPVVYYAGFALVDPALLALLLAAVRARQCGRPALAAVALAAATLVRAPAGFLAVGFVAADLLAGADGWGSRTPPPNPSAADASRARWFPTAWLLLVPLPHLAWGAMCSRAWGASFLGVIRPVYGWPGCILAGAGGVGHVRAVYVVACLVFMAISTVALGWLAWRSRGRDALVTSGAVFCAVFLVFHLCLRSMVYRGTPIALFNYLDRYLVALWPFALLPWLRFVRPWMVVAAGVASTVLAAWWTHNYFIDLARQTAGM